MKAPGESVLILHHAVPAIPSGLTAASDAGVMDEVASVAAALKELSIPHRTAAAARLSDIPRILESAPETVVFNLVENFEEGGTAEAMQVPTLCDAFRKPCTGNDSLSQTLCLHKWRTKGVLQAAGLPVPSGRVVAPGQTPDRHSLPPPPWIVKPASADASEGIHSGSVIQGDFRALCSAIRKLHRLFRQPALVESFFGCRELNVAILEQGNRLRLLPISEIEFRNYGARRPRIVDYSAKWRPDSFEYRNTVRVVPARLAPSIARAIRTAALRAWQAVGCRDYARVDFRMDGQGGFVILEVNPNPDIAPESGFAASLAAAGVPFRQFVKTIVNNAASRGTTLLPAPTPKPSKRAATHATPYRIRRTESQDRDPILRFMRNTGFFHEGEMQVAREVLDDAIRDGANGHYQSFSLMEGEKPVGWICFGPTPCTMGTYDIYWIGISPKHQGRGYGRALLEFAERSIRRAKGRLVIIETSGRSTYDSTRGFYLATGYRESARVPDFYMPGDARVIYSKPLVFS